METEVWRAAYPETLGETLGPRFGLVSDLVLVQLETWKNEQPESRVSWGSQTNNRVEAVAPHKRSHHGSTNHSPIFWDLPRSHTNSVFGGKKLFPALSPKLFLSSANKGSCSYAVHAFT